MTSSETDRSLADAIHRQWLATHAAYRTPVAILVYTLAIVAVAALGLFEEGKALLGPGPEAVIGCLGFTLIVFWSAALAYHIKGVESRLYRLTDLLETLTLQAVSMLLVALTPGGESLFWLVYLGHMMMLPLEPNGRRLVPLVVQLGPLLVALRFLAGGDPEAALFSLGGALGGALTWRRSQGDKRALVSEMAARERLASEVERLGVHAARTRIAAHLHEGLGADLEQLRAETEALRADPALLPELGALAERAQASLAELRLAVWVVERPGRTFADLVAHLEQGLGELVRDKAVLELSQVVAGAGRDTAIIPGDVCLALMRVLQEATRNALTHGRARRVKVAIGLDEALTASVEDDGLGAAEGTALARRDGRGGLVNMEVRARQLGGTLRVSSGPAGTRVEIALPRLGWAAAPGSPT